jgi:Cu+-exporting ATPase
MAALVADAQSGKAPVQRMADRVAAVFVPIVLAIAAATFVFWLLVGESASFALGAAIAVLVISCPCALGLATPTALLAGTGRGAQLGILIRGPEVLESTRRIDTIVLDKTGTITEGAMRVLGVSTASGFDRDDVLRLAASAEAGSEHPIGRAISSAVPAAQRLSVTDFRAHAGSGVTGVVDGHRVDIGRPSLSLPSELDQSRRDAEAAGTTAVVVAVDGVPSALIAVGDRVKATSREAAERLRGLEISPVLLTGDNETVARSVAAQVGITEVVSNVLPAGKVDVVKRLQDAGHVVAMVGDGVNDAAALAQADLGVAMGGGTDAARAAADLTLVRDDLRSAGDAIRLSRRTLRTIKGNLAWAFGYNVAAIPIAAAGLLNPMLAGLAMAFSSVFVVSNSLRLFRFR